MSAQKRRTFKIEAFKHRVDIDPKYAERTWKVLEHAIHEIYNHNASGLSFEELYSCHWILTVIEPYTEIVYVLDSLSHRMRYEDWKYIVEMALRLFNSNKGRKGRKKPVWEILQAPRQSDGKQCGYYVMRFMRQIIAEIETIERDRLRSIFKAAEYTRAEIDEVHSEVADYIQDHIYE